MTCGSRTSMLTYTNRRSACCSLTVGKDVCGNRREAWSIVIFERMHESPGLEKPLHPSQCQCRQIAEDRHARLRYLAKNQHSGEVQTGAHAAHTVPPT